MCECAYVLVRESLLMRRQIVFDYIADGWCCTSTMPQSYLRSRSSRLRLAKRERERGLYFDLALKRRKCQMHVCLQFRHGETGALDFLS
jgi:hypothetical protein